MNSQCILLIEHDSARRKAFRRQLEHDGCGVLAVNSIGEALVRLRVRHYRFVVCTSHHVTRSPGDSGILIDAAGLLSRSEAVGYELYLPGIGIDANAVLMVPTGDPERLSRAVQDAVLRLEGAAAR